MKCSAICPRQDLERAGCLGGHEVGDVCCPQREWLGCRGMHSASCKSFPVPEGCLTHWSVHWVLGFCLSFLSSWLWQKTWQRWCGEEGFPWLQFIIEGKLKQLVTSTDKDRERIHSCLLSAQPNFSFLYALGPHHREWCQCGRVFLPQSMQSRQSPTDLPTSQADLGNLSIRSLSQMTLHCMKTTELAITAT